MTTKKLLHILALAVALQPIGASAQSSKNRIIAWCGILTAATALVCYMYRDTIAGWFSKPKKDEKVNIKPPITPIKQAKKLTNTDLTDPDDKNLERIIKLFAPSQEPELKLDNYGKPTMSEYELTSYILFKLKNKQKELSTFINSENWGKFERLHLTYSYVNCKTKKFDFSPFIFLFYSGYIHAVNLLLATGLLDTKTEYSDGYDCRTNEPNSASHSFLGNLVKVRSALTKEPYIDSTLTRQILGSHGATTFKNQTENINSNTSLAPITNKTNQSQLKLFFSADGQNAVNKAKFLKELENYLKSKN